MFRRSAWLFLFLLFLVAPSACFGQSSASPIRVSLSGYVREEGSAQLIVGARVDLLNAMGSPIESTYSNGNGIYEFHEIPGDCYVVVQHDGYASVREFIRPGGAPHVDRDIFLRPQPSGLAANAVNPVSQHQLSVPSKARESFDKGIQLVVQKSDYRGAIAQFEKAIARFPDYYEAYAAMGLAQDKMGDAQAAEGSLRKSIEMSNEKYSQAMIDLGSLLNGGKRFSESEPLLRKVVAQDGSSWRGHYELAVALTGENRYKDALASAVASRDLKSDNPQTFLLLYKLHIETDDFPAALQDTDGYLKLVPTGSMADRVRKMQERLQQTLKTSTTPASHP